MVMDRHNRSHKPKGTPDGGRYETKNGSAGSDDVTPPMDADPSARIISSHEPLTGDDIEYIRTASGPDTIGLMAAHRPEVDACLASNPNITEDDVDRLVFRQKSNSARADTVSGACMRPVMSDAFLARCVGWMRDQTPRIRHAAVDAIGSNPHAAPELVKESLWADPCMRQAVRVAANPAADDSTLALAVNIHPRDSSVFAGKVLRHPHCGPDALHAIDERTTDPWIRERVWSHPRMDMATLADWKSHVSYDRYEAAFGAAMSPKLDFALASSLASLNNPDVDRRLAYNPRTPSELLGSFAGRGDRQTDLNLARNPSLPLASLKVLRDRYPDDSDMHAILAGNPVLSGLR